MNAALPEETDLEVALQAHLRAQVAEFGSTMVDADTLRDVVRGGGWYDTFDALTAAYWLAEDQGWQVERVPLASRDKVDALVAVKRPLLRIYDPQCHAPAGQTLRIVCGKAE